MANSLAIIMRASWLLVTVFAGGFSKVDPGACLRRATNEAALEVVDSRGHQPEEIPNAGWRSDRSSDSGANDILERRTFAGASRSASFKESRSSSRVFEALLHDSPCADSKTKTRT